MFWICSKSDVSVGSVLDTHSDRVCLDDIFPAAPMADRQEMFQTYTAWLASGRGDFAMPNEDASSELFDTKIELLLKVGEALKDEAFCCQLAKQQAEKAEQDPSRD